MYSCAVNIFLLSSDIDLVHLTVTGKGCMFTLSFVEFFYLRWTLVSVVFFLALVMFEVSADLHNLLLFINWRRA